MGDIQSTDEGVKFLGRDFDQCFQMMRHYDTQIAEVVKFSMTAYSAIVGAALTLYSYGLEKKIDLRATAIALLIVGILFGMIMLGFIVRNRTYFVLVARYVNEHRAFFLKVRPLGFENSTRMYVNSAQPPYFDWRSSQEWFLYTISLLNAALLGLTFYFAFVGSCFQWWMVAGGAVGLLLIQLGVSIHYLHGREGKSASAAVFGVD